MRSVFCAVVVLVAIPAFASDKTAVRELDVRNVKLALPGSYEIDERLTEIRTDCELARSTAFANDASREAVKKQVDFSKEKVVVFTWWGRTPSSVRTKLAEDGKTIGFSVVTANPALADLCAHATLFAVPKDVPVACGIDLLKLSLQDGM